MIIKWISVCKLFGTETGRLWALCKACLLIFSHERQEYQNYCCRDRFQSVRYGQRTKWVPCAFSSGLNIQSEAEPLCFFRPSLAGEETDRDPEKLMQLQSHFPCFTNEIHYLSSCGEEPREKQTPLGEEKILYYGSLEIQGEEENIFPHEPMVPEARWARIALCPPISVPSWFRTKPAAAPFRWDQSFNVNHFTWAHFSRSRPTYLQKCPNIAIAECHLSCTLVSNWDTWERKIYNLKGWTSSPPLPYLHKEELM